MKSRGLTKATALAEARRRWGDNAAVSDRGRSTSKAEREAAHEARENLRHVWPKNKREWTREQREEDDRLFSIAIGYRYSVGEIALGMFFSVKGQGDTWEEAFAKADKR